MDSRSLAAQIDAELQSRGTAERAEHEKSYLKSDLRHYGTSVPAIRAVVKSVRQHHQDLDHDELVALVQALWDERVHERRMAAVELLDLHSGRLVAADMALLERLLREARTWALVDGLAASVVGPLVERDPDAAAVLDRWAVDDDFWIRRSALLALLLALRRGDGDFARFSKYADALLDEKEFFIRKAIGWVLRDTARKRPTMVYEWLLTRARRASGVTLREAVKPLSDNQRDAVLAARSPAEGRSQAPVTTTRVARHIAAPPATVYRALLDAEAVRQWMVPDHMTSHIHSFDAREGGRFRISLTYDRPTTAGKTNPQTDSFHGRFVKLVPDAEVVQVVEFETDDPAMKGEMTITYVLTDSNGGTDLVGVHENLPRGVPPADNELGWRMSIDKLASLVEIDRSTR